MPPKQPRNNPSIDTSSSHEKSPYVISFDSDATAQTQQPIEPLNLLAHLTQGPMPSQDEPVHLELLLTDLSGQQQEQCTTPTLQLPLHAPLVREPSHSDIETFFEELDLPIMEDPEESDLVLLEELTEEPPPQELPPTATIDPPVAQTPPRYAFLPHEWHRAVVTFIVVCFVLVAPLHAMHLATAAKKTQSTIEQTGIHAAAQLSEGIGSSLADNPSEATVAFTRASSSFASAQEELETLGVGLNTLLRFLPGTHSAYKSGTALLNAGEDISAAAILLSRAMEQLDANQDLPPTQRLRVATTYLHEAFPLLERANNQLTKVSADLLPTEHQGTLLKLQTTLPHVIVATEEFLSFSEIMQTLLGDDQTKRYLVLFQNNTEARATGGFIGSFAELDVRNGEIIRLDIPEGGSYDLQGQFEKEFVAPKPLQLLSAKWEFRDGNWFPDFPTSARSLLTLYENAGGPTIDGVVAINATYVASLLALLGPIAMPDYGRTITTDNFLKETQKIVELEYDREKNNPKAFIGDLAPVLLANITEKRAHELLPVIEHVSSGLYTRDIQLYLRDADAQKEVLTLGWGGRIKETHGDYVMVVNTNLGGGKTDAVIEEDVVITSDIDTDGHIVNTVTIERTHFGDDGETFTGVNNVNYVRLYTPKGSQLINVSGTAIPPAELFEQPEDDWSMTDELLYTTQEHTTHSASETDMWEESGKTVFGNWSQTKPGETSTMTFVYRLPFRLHDLSETPTWWRRVASWLGLTQPLPYHLVVQQPSGILDRETRIHIHPPESLQPLWQSHDLAHVNAHSSQDVVVSALLDPR